MPLTTRLVATTTLATAIAVLSTACSGGTNSVAPSPGGGACTATSTSTTITISNNAVCPQNVTVPRGTQVTFANQDSRDHQINSDPHPEHTDCPELNQVGFLAAGQSRQSGNLNTARVCGFHDHIQFENKSLQGSITIQ
jgi:plastocyanin